MYNVLGRCLLCGDTVFNTERECGHIATLVVLRWGHNYCVSGLWVGSVSQREGLNDAGPCKVNSLICPSFPMQ